VQFLIGDLADIVLLFPLEKDCDLVCDRRVEMAVEAFRDLSK
jgi:hypothetical protein